MSTLVKPKASGTNILLIKGAVEIVLKNCKYIKLSNKKIVPKTQEH